MELPTYFSDFLGKIRLTDSQIDDCRTGHTTLRSRLLSDDFGVLRSAGVPMPGLELELGLAEGRASPGTW